MSMLSSCPSASGISGVSGKPTSSGAASILLTDSAISGIGLPSLAGSSVSDIPATSAPIFSASTIASAISGISPGTS